MVKSYGIVRNKHNGLSPLATSVKNTPTSELFPLGERAPSGGEGGVTRPVGMLPIAKSKHFESWDLPGHGEPYGDCGRFGWKGCLNIAGHGYRLDVGTEYAGKVYVKGFRRSCDRAECPICFEKWASRAGARAERRLKLYKGGYRRAVHVSISLKAEDWGLPYPKLKAKARSILQSVGVEGGVMVFHPWRKDVRGWYESPHFHIVGYGWIVGTKEAYEKTGWIVHNIGCRKTVRGTLSYQLSHAGIHPDYHTLSWFGALSYNKFKVDDVEPEEICPLCGEKLIMLRWVGLGEPPPEVEDEYFLDPKGWMPKSVNVYG